MCEENPTNHPSLPSEPINRMNRSSRHREKLAIKSEIHRDNGNEESAARTRPVSYDDIMLRRKSKNKPEDLLAKPDTEDLSGKISKPEVHNSSQSDRAYRSTKLSSTIVGKPSSEDFVKVKSRQNEVNMSRDKITRNIEKDSRDRVIRSNPSTYRDIGYTPRRSKDDRRDEGNRRNDNWSNGKIGTEYDKRPSRDMIERERYADRARGRPVKEIEKRPRNDDVERKTEREIKRKDRIDDEERSMQQIAVKKHDSGDRHKLEAPERKDRKELSQYYSEKSRSVKKRSRSRDRDKDKGRSRSRSRSPRPHRGALNNVREHRDMALQSSKDRSRREQADNERHKISNNESNGQYRRHGEKPSGLGGYSPRKRRSEARVKTPSPPHRSPEKKNPGSDIPPGPNITFIPSILPSVQSLSQTGTSTTHEFPIMPPITSTTVRVIPGLFSYASVDSVQLTQATRPMRRLYVENLPDSASEKTLMEYLNSLLLSSGVNRVPGSQPCISCTIHKEKGQALVEFLTPEDASAALCFDGRSFSGSVLKIRRPKDYSDAATGVADKSVMVTLDSSTNAVRDSPHKIFVGGIPKVISSEMLREIVTAFGPLKAFHFEVNVDPDGPCAFLEYVDQSVTYKACAGLNAMRLGGKMLTVVQATPDASIVEKFGSSPFYSIPEYAKPLLEKPTQVLKLKNVLDSDGLSSLSEPELEEILEDVRLECVRFGTVISVNVIKHSHHESTRETHQDPDGTGCGDEKVKSDVENMKTEHDGEQTDGKISEDDRPSNEKNLAENAAPLESDPSFGVDHQPLDQNGDKIDDKETDLNPEIETETKAEQVMKTEASSEAVSSARMDSSDVKKDENEGVFEPGSIVVEFKRVEASSMAAHCLHRRLFDDKIVTVEYVDYDVYRARIMK